MTRETDCEYTVVYNPANIHGIASDPACRALWHVHLPKRIKASIWDLSTRLFIAGSPRASRMGGHLKYCM